MWLAAISTGVRWVAGGEEKVEALLPLLYFSGLLLYVLSTLLHYLLVSLEASRAAESLARDSQLKALRMQINPHFLFNSLNSISALATLDGARARDMCIRLSDLLRSTLQVGEKQTISLKDEIALSVNYLEVERVRFGARLMIEREFQDMCGECSVPPLMVQPLVENAVKHGIAGLVEGGVVRLEAKCGNGRLLIRVVNPFDPEMPAPRQSGFGLANVRQRLAARYGDDASFESSSENSEFRAELRFPCGGAAELA